MPSHNNTAQYDPRRSDAYNTVSLIASADLQATRDRGYVSATSNSLQNQSDVAAAGALGAFSLATTAPGFNGSSRDAQSMSRVQVGSGALNAPVSLPSNPSLPEQYQPPQRASISGRQPEELHIPPLSTAMADYNRYQAPPAYAGSENLSINVQPSTPQHLSSAAGNTLPGALQPGPVGRPGPLSSNTAPGSIPTLPHISTHTQQPPGSARSANLNHSHSYSRSSPTTLEQSKYKAFTNPSESKYVPSNPMSIPHTPQASSYSPLGLADIRSQVDAGYADDLRSPGFYQGAAEQQYPTNSNYLAPWPIYATDWCKWPPRSHGNHAGKIAIGSYLEDNHNYVRLILHGHP